MSMPIAPCSSTATACSRDGSTSTRAAATERRGDDARSRPHGYAEPAGGRLERAAAAAGLDALLVGVGAELRYLHGLPRACRSSGSRCSSCPAAAGAPITLIAPRLEATPARTLPGGGRRGRSTVATWEETEDPMLARRRDARGGARARPAGELRAVAVSDGLRAAFVLGLQRVLPGARFSLASAVLRASSGCARTTTRSSCCGRRRTPRTGSIAAIAAGRARRPDRGRRRARGPRPAHRRGPRARRVLDRRLRAQQRLAPPRAGRAGHRGRRADRDRHRRHGRGLRRATSRARSG